MVGGAQQANGPKMDPLIQSTNCQKLVVDSCGTLILYQEKISSGTALPKRLTRLHTQPNLCIDLAPSLFKAEQYFKSLIVWITKHQIEALNIAGPRASTRPLIYSSAYSFLSEALSQRSHICRAMN